MQGIEAIKEEAKGHPLPYFAFIFLLFAFFASSVCALQIPMFAYGANASWNQPSLFFTLFGTSIALGVIAFVFSTRVFHIKINRFLLVLFVLMCLGGIVGTLCHGSVFSHSGKQGTVVIDDASFLIRGESICVSLLASFTLFAFFQFLPFSRRSRASGFLIAEIFILIALASLAYSLVTEMKEYGKALGEGLFSVEITSWLGQKNIYAYYLLLGFFAEIFLLEISGQRWRYLLMAVFIVGILFSGSKAAILIAVITYLVYLLYRLIRSKKEGTFAFKNALIPLVTILLAIVGIIVIAITKPSFFSSLIDAFVSFFKDEGGSNVSSRGAIWSSAISLTTQTPANLVFGHGDLIFPYLLSSSMDVQAIGSAHNAYLEMLGRGGILRLLCFTAFAVYVIRLYVLKAKKSFRDYFVPLLFMVMMVARSLIESVFVFDVTSSTLFYSYFILMPILSENGLVSVKEAGEKPNMDAWKKTLARFYGPLLVFVLALACCFIPRPYAWIVASGIALFGLIVTLALFYKKREFFYKTLEDQCSVLAGLICLIAFAALPMGGFTVLGTLLCPLLVASSLKVLLFHLREGASERDAIEEIYAICLVKIDDKNHSSKRK